MNEVALGYTEEEAKLEAMRCLQCKTPCMAAVRADSIKDFIAAIAEGNTRQPLRSQENLLPAVCGRVSAGGSVPEKCTVD